MNNDDIRNITIYLNDTSEYIKDKKIGEGGLTEAFIFLKNGQKYVGKVFSSVDPSNLKLFLREIHILTLNYPSILRLLAWNVIQKPILITHYMENGTLEDFISNKNIYPGDITERNTQKQIILYGVSKGMEYLHLNKILYRDLKPSNILLDKNMEPIISDFNLSKFDSNSGQKSTHSIICGTVKYFAPELLRNTLQYDNKIDVYAFGLMMYEIITDSLLPLRYENIEKEINNNHFLKEQEYAKFNELITKCISKNSSDRPDFKTIVNFFAENSLPEINEDKFHAYCQKLSDFEDRNRHNTLIQMQDTDYGMYFQRIASNYSVKNPNGLFKKFNLLNLSMHLQDSEPRQEYINLLDPIKEYFRYKNDEIYNYIVELINKYTNKNEEQSAREQGNQNISGETNSCINSNLQIPKRSNDEQENVAQPFNPIAISTSIDNSSFITKDNEIKKQYIYEFSSINVDQYNKSHDMPFLLLFKIEDINATEMHIKDKYNKSNKIILNNFPKEKILILQKYQWLASDKVEVTRSNNEYSLKIDYEPNKTNYFHIPSNQELVNYGLLNFQDYVFTNFHDAVKLRFFLERTNVIAAIAGYQQATTRDGGIYYKLRLIDSNANQATLTLFGNYDFDLDKVYIFSQADINKYKNIISFKITSRYFIYRLNEKSKEYNFPYDKYSEIIEKAKNGEFYHSVFPLAEERSITNDLLRNRELYVVNAKITSISLYKIKYVHKNRNILEDLFPPYEVSIKNDKIQVVDYQGNIMVPQIFLKVRLTNPESPENSITAYANHPAVVNYLLCLAENTQMNNFNYFQDILQQNSDINNFEYQIKMFVDDNDDHKRLNITKQVLIRVYEGIRYQNIAYIEKIYENDSHEIKNDVLPDFEQEELLDILGQVNKDEIYYNEKALKKAADKGDNVDDIKLYASCLHKVKGEKPRSIGYYKMAADKGNSECKYEIGKLLFEELDDRDDGLLYLRKAANEENKKAKIYLQQNHLEKDEDEEHKKISPRQ